MNLINYPFREAFELFNANQEKSVRIINLKNKIANLDRTILKFQSYLDLSVENEVKLFKAISHRSDLQKELNKLERKDYAKLTLRRVS